MLWFNFLFLLFVILSNCFLLLTSELSHTQQICLSHTESENLKKAAKECRVSCRSFHVSQMSDLRCSYFQLPVFCSFYLTCIGADFFHLHSGKHGKRTSSTSSSPSEGERKRETEGQTEQEMFESTGNAAKNYFHHQTPHYHLKRHSLPSPRTH